MKFLDLIGVIGLFLIFPFILLVIIIVLIADGYPAIYSHKRIGKNSKIFQCYKIRTMKNNIDNIIKSDPNLFK